MKTVLIKLIEVYQFLLSPDHSFWAKSLNKPPYCRHIPSCSQYTKEAIDKKGVLKGTFMGIKRILRCMPWNKPSYDPVERKK